jgi:hypothetical protein
VSSVTARRGLLAADAIEAMRKSGLSAEARKLFSQVLPSLSALAARQTGNRDAHVALARLLAAGDALPGNDSPLVGTAACTAWGRAQALQALASDELASAQRQCPKGY